MIRSLLTALSLTAAFSTTAHAQSAYPSKNISYIIPFVPGGESDVVARWQQDLFQKRHAPHQIVVLNRPGAGGALAWSQLNRETPDGHTVTGVNLPHLVLQPLEGNVQYKTDDITSVYFFHYTPDAIIVPANSPYRNLAELIAAAQREPERLSIAGSGTNSANHAATVRLQSMANIRLTYVPFKGTGDLVSSLVGGHVQAAMSYTTLALQLKERVRMLAVATAQRHPLFPDVPTFRELGFDWVDGAYRGVAVPKDTPEAVRQQVSKLFADLNSDADMRKRKSAAGFELVDISYSQIPDFMRQRAQAYQADARRLGLIKP
jgi:tripartite-type tricarboxylate transporter receptor subunit TctC